MFEHPPYLPDLNCEIIICAQGLKVFLGKKRFLTEDKLKVSVRLYLSNLVVQYYNADIQKLVHDIINVLIMEGNVLRNKVYLTTFWYSFRLDWLHI